MKILFLLDGLSVFTRLVAMQHRKGLRSYYMAQSSAKDADCVCSKHLVFFLPKQWFINLFVLSGRILSMLAYICDLLMGCGY